MPQMKWGCRLKGAWWTEASSTGIPLLSEPPSMLGSLMNQKTPKTTSTTQPKTT